MHTMTRDTERNYTFGFCSLKMPFCNPNFIRRRFALLLHFAAKMCGSLRHALCNLLRVPKWSGEPEEVPGFGFATLASRGVDPARSYPASRHYPFAAARWRASRERAVVEPVHRRRFVRRASRALPPWAAMALRTALLRARRNIGMKNREATIRQKAY